MTLARISLLDLLFYHSSHTLLAPLSLSLWARAFVLFKVITLNYVYFIRLSFDKKPASCHPIVFHFLPFNRRTNLHVLYSYIPECPYGYYLFSSRLHPAYLADGFYSLGRLIVQLRIKVFNFFFLEDKLNFKNNISLRSGFNGRKLRKN